LRLSRPLIGIAVGAALGFAGGVTQVLTRNPLADPGLRGVNAGASAAVVTAIAVLGVTSFTGRLWLALLGAVVAAVGLAAAARTPGTPPVTGRAHRPGRTTGSTARRPAVQQRPGVTQGRSAPPGGRLPRRSRG
jgi:hypothetical protein